MGSFAFDREETRKEISNSNEDLDDYKYRLLRLVDVQDGVIDYDNLLEIRKSDVPEIYFGKINGYDGFIQTGNLIIGKNDPTKISVATVDDDTKIIPTANFYVIKFDESKLDPWYVFAYLKSDDDILKRRMLTRTLPTLSREAIESISIPFLDMDEQKRIGEEFKIRFDAVAKKKKELQKESNELKKVFDIMTKDIKK